MYIPGGDGGTGGTAAAIASASFVSSSLTVPMDLLLPFLFFGAGRFFSAHNWASIFCCSTVLVGPLLMIMVVIMMIIVIIMMVIMMIVMVMIMMVMMMIMVMIVIIT
jgi:hypothetical protein